MAVPEHRRWMYKRLLPGNVGYTQEFMNGVKEFDEFAKAYAPKDNQKYRCPCSNCKNTKFLFPAVVQAHLYLRGFTKGYWYWTSHGEVEPQDCGEANMCPGSSSCMDLPHSCGIPNHGEMTLGDQIKRIPILNYLERFPEAHAPAPKIKNKKRQEKISSDDDDTLSSQSHDDDDNDDDDDDDEFGSDGENSQYSDSSDPSETATMDWGHCKACKILSMHELIWMTHGLYAELRNERSSNKELQERLHEELLGIIAKRDNDMNELLKIQCQGFSDMMRSLLQEKKAVLRLTDLVITSLEEMKQLASSSKGPSRVKVDACESLPSSFKGDASESSASDK